MGDGDLTVEEVVDDHLADERLERLFDGAECLDCKRMMTMQDEPWEGDRSMRDAGTALGFDTCDVYYQPVVNRFFRACDAAGRAATN